MKDSDILRPVNTFVVVDEDPSSINDSMLMVDEEQGMGLVDFPSRLHSMGYGINFADVMPRFSCSKIRVRQQCGPLYHPGKAARGMLITGSFITTPLGPGFRKLRNRLLHRCARPLSLHKALSFSRKVLT